MASTCRSVTRPTLDGGTRSSTPSSRHGTMTKVRHHSELRPNRSDRRHPAAGRRAGGLRSHPRRRQPRPADDHPQQCRGRLRPDRPRGGEGDGGGRHHRRLVHGRQHRRRRWCRCDDLADGPGRRREHDDDRRARRRGVDLLLRERVRRQRRHPAGAADERAGGHPGRRRLAVPDGRGLRRGVEGRPGLDPDRRRLVARRSRPPLPDAARGRARDRPQRRQLRVVRRRRAADDRAARREDRGRVLRARRVRRLRRRGRPARPGGVG